jgi:hypothetical protein
MGTGGSITVTSGGSGGGGGGGGLPTSMHIDPSTVSSWITTYKTGVIKEK